MPDIGFIDLSLEILSNQAKFHQDPDTSDVTFVIGRKKLLAHRYPLASQSMFFHVLLYGKSYIESGKGNVKLEVPFNAMKMLLTFAYTGKINLNTYALPDITDLLELAHRYGFQKLEELIAQYLCIAVNAKNDIHAVLEVACLVDRANLIERCWMIVEMIVEGVYDVELNLTLNQLKELMNRTPRNVSEVKLFQLAHKLTQKQKFCTGAEKTAIFSKIDFSKMTAENLIYIVEPTQVLGEGVLADTIRRFSLLKASPLDKHFSEFATVLLGNNPDSLFRTGDQFTTPDENENCILIDLNALRSINWMKFTLNSKGQQDGYSGYCIELSTSRETWTRVVDYSLQRCSKDQTLYFTQLNARFVKIVRVSGGVECNSLKIGYVEDSKKSIGGFVCPEENVAVPKKAYAFYKHNLDPFTLKMCLLKGNYENQGNQTPYISHITKKGHIIVQFMQPYILDSCRFLLWDFDGRKYSYKVKVASDQNLQYEIISDKSDELLDGWQRIDFAPRPVIRFRIEGVKATIGYELRLVHFEAPARHQMVMENGLKKMKL